MVMLKGNEELLTKKNMHQNEDLKAWYYLKKCTFFVDFYARVLN